MNRPLARRAGPFLVALTGLLLTAAGAVPRGQEVAPPRQAPWPTPALPDAGESTLARGVWDGNAVTNLTDIFATGATGTESSRMAFGRDGMIYMTLEPVEATTTR